MTLTDLMEAIERLHEEPTFEELPPCFRYVLDIADCFTNDTPISIHVCKEVGFVDPRNEGGMLFWDGAGRNRLIAFNFEAVEILLDGKKVHPQPRTLGDLYALMYRMSRKGT